MSEPQFDFTSDLSDVLRDAEPELMPPISATAKVGMSLRLPSSVMQELMQRADERGLGHTVLAAELIEAGLAAMREQALVPLADVQRVLAQLARSTPPAA
ncbi:MAG: hypothetical protein WAL50_18230 [Kineosporiaceae bacterium]|jgi:hypothetical protein